jgi:uncharacterized phage-associated protein
LALLAAMPTGEMEMSVFDVAEYILQACGEMTAMKLQKLVYYSQCWSLVWDERPLFDERIEAWANGPVCPPLYEKHRGTFRLSPGSIGGNPETLDKDERETIDIVLKFYGEKTAQWLSDLTHSEAPWKEAREGLSPGDRSNRRITESAMAEYYGSL